VQLVLRVLDPGVNVAHQQLGGTRASRLHAGLEHLLDLVGRKDVLVHLAGRRPGRPGAGRRCKSSDRLSIVPPRWSSRRPLTADGQVGELVLSGPCAEVSTASHRSFPPTLPAATNALPHGEARASYRSVMSQLQRVVNIRLQPDGSWTAHPQPPLPAVGTFVTHGWPQVAQLRETYNAVDHFETNQLPLFVEQFGPPPADG